MYAMNQCLDLPLDNRACLSPRQMHSDRSGSVSTMLPILYMDTLLVFDCARLDSSNRRIAVLFQCFRNRPVRSAMVSGFGVGELYLWSSNHINLPRIQLFLLSNSAPS